MVLLHQVPPYIHNYVASKHHSVGTICMRDNATVWLYAVKEKASKRFVILGVTTLTIFPTSLSDLEKVKSNGEMGTA